jgi:RNA polymerase primary sigma factor
MRPPPYVTNPELQRPGTEAKLFKDWPGQAFSAGRLGPEDEVLLFKQLHYCGYMLSKLYKSAGRGRVSSIKQRYSKWVQSYNDVRTRLTEGNLGLMYDLLGRSRFENLDRDEMCSEGMLALLRAVDTFDPWRGFRFSTYACNAIIRAFARAALQDSKRRSKIIGPYEVDFERSNLPETRHTDQRALFEERLQRILRLDNADLTDIEKTVLARRFPLEEGRRRQTLEDIGKQMRVSKERVRQIQLSAIAKLRRAIKDDEVLD